MTTTLLGTYLSTPPTPTSLHCHFDSYDIVCLVVLSTKQTSKVLAEKHLQAAKIGCRQNDFSKTRVERKCSQLFANGCQLQRTSTSSRHFIF